ncbi:MAG: DUF2062 domain-containing protein [Opitutus sp.]
MSPEDPPEEQNPGRLARRRRAKKLLRLMPRRAVMHKYPLIGRFADFARRRAYLWSFRTENLRPSFYAGSVLSVLPVMGVQLPVAFVLCLVLRGNFMVMGGLQFITNPFTAAPIYYATHHLGLKIIEVSGLGASIPFVEEPGPTAAEDLTEPAPQLEPATVAPPESIHWTRRVGTAINALVIGGVVCGTLLGATLDLIWHALTSGEPRKNSPHNRRDSPSTTEPRTPE